MHICKYRDSGIAYRLVDFAGIPVVVGLYPYESRWLPLQLFMHDEAITQILDVPNVVRRLNMLRVMIKTAKESEGLLRKLQLSLKDVMQCVELDTIQKRSLTSQITFVFYNLEISLEISVRSCISGQADRAGLCDEYQGQPRPVSRRSSFSRPWMAQPHSNWKFMLGGSRVD
ncbi:hypothetical protein EG68_03851 [Paragonimus skrjabini miyazakii]|uniref:Uncharacterized protein n=1 Tax=Paragonimus skrjabini miyazakii TaxID=59628 RepID=A0A8S9YW41_9TREM|nr:hypothetical protein EG68_03851 [Paragonimus skrjabini miyazakii]